MPVTSIIRQGKQRSKKGHNISFKNKSLAESHQPGVQKLKSSLRQTRRLLSKDNLAADVRIETERRLRALEQDLSTAQAASKERHIATKYHKIKFFERQKIVRKIEQAKRKSDSDSLRELRVDLNYILHYPKSKKYISLFPSTSSPDTDAERNKLRDWIRENMEKGELSHEPETTLSNQSHSDKRPTPDWALDISKVPPRNNRVVQASNDESEDDFFGDDD